jgi:hypothetical protein
MRPGKRGRLATRVAMVVALGAVIAGGLWAILGADNTIVTPNDVVWGYSADH